MTPAQPSGLGDLKRGQIAWQWEDIGLYTEGRQALENEINRGDEGVVEDVGGSISPDQDTANPAAAIDDHRTGIARRGKWPRFRIRWQNRYLLRHFARYATAVLSDKTADCVEPANGQFGGVAIFYDHDDRVVVLIFGTWIRTKHFTIWDGPEAP